MTAPLEQRMVPAEQYEMLPPAAATAPVYAEAPPPAVAYQPAMAAQPAPTAEPTPQTYPENSAFAAVQRDTSLRPRGRTSFGIEGYYDEYKEDSVSLVDQGIFGSITATHDYYFNDTVFATLDGRGSYGSTDYESISGTIDDITQWEIEGRVLIGRDANLSDASRFRYYTGLGGRYFVDELEGKVSSLGFAGYDRRIFQLYLPVGITYEFRAYGLQFAPNLEYNHLLYGYVNSRLGVIPGLYDLENTQDEGYGLRGEFLVGDINERGRGWQFGPFFRYWDIADSDIVTNPAGSWIEPENTRLQAGAKLKFLF